MVNKTTFEKQSANRYIAYTASYIYFIKKIESGCWRYTCYDAETLCKVGKVGYKRTLGQVKLELAEW